MARYEQLVELFLNQFEDGENFNKVLKIVGDRLDDTDSIYADLAFKTWQDTAIGIWLDWRGDWVGVDRPKKFADDASIFTVRSLATPDDPAKGISGVGSPTGGKIAGVNGLQLDELADDNSYREYIVAKEFTTNLAPTMKSIVLFCQHIGIQVDVESPVTGFIVVRPQGTTTREQREIIKLLAPRLGGVFLRTDPI